MSENNLDWDVVHYRIFDFLTADPMVSDGTVKLGNDIFCLENQIIEFMELVHFDLEITKSGVKRYKPLEFIISDISPAKEDIPKLFDIKYTVFNRNNEAVVHGSTHIMDKILCQASERIEFDPPCDFIINSIEGFDFQREYFVKSFSKEESIPNNIKKPVQEFSSGATREPELENFYDIPGEFLIRLGAICQEGAKKYGDGKTSPWYKGLSNRSTYNHLIKHLQLWKADDTKEDHLAKAAWGIMVLMFEQQVGNGDINRERYLELMK